MVILRGLMTHPGSKSSEESNGTGAFANRPYLIPSYSLTGDLLSFQGVGPTSIREPWGDSQQHVPFRCGSGNLSTAY